MSTPTERAHLLAQLKQLWDRAPDKSLCKLIERIVINKGWHVEELGSLEDKMLFCDLLKLNAVKGRIDWSILDREE